MQISIEKCQICRFLRNYFLNYAYFNLWNKKLQLFTYIYKSIFFQFSIQIKINYFDFEIEITIIWRSFCGMQQPYMKKFNTGIDFEHLSDNQLIWWIPSTTFSYGFYNIVWFEYLLALLWVVTSKLYTLLWVNRG